MGPTMKGPRRLSGVNWLALLVSTGSLVACGGYAVPTERMVSAESAARGAQEVGAPNAPQAALHLRLAQEEIASAKTLIGNGDNERADYVLIRAKADAELALALAKEANAKADAQKAADQIKSMQGGQQ
jgi:hypothetical protein